MRTSAAGSNTPALPRRGGFTLIELLVVMTLIALGTAGVSLALRDSGQTALERDAQRLAAVLEAARAQSRAAGVPVHWQPTAQGFSVSGLSPQPQAYGWLDAGTRATGTPRLTLGPEPVIGAQSVVLTRNDPPGAALRVATDGLRPFAVQPLESP